MTNQKYVKVSFRCDNCGGNGQGCCDNDQHVVQVNTFDEGVLQADGYSPEEMPNGERVYFTPFGVITIDPSGWGDDFVPFPK